MEKFNVSLTRNDIILITSILSHCSGLSFIAINGELILRLRELYDRFSKISI